MATNVLDLRKFSAQMAGHRWTVSLRRELEAVPAAVLMRWPDPSPSYRTLVCGLTECVSPTRQTWLIVGDMFEVEAPRFRWNEFELWALEWAEGDADYTAQVVDFWSRHIPVMVDVASDYDVWLLRYGDGVIVHTFAPEWEAGGTIVANSLISFLKMLAETGEPPWDLE